MSITAAQLRVVVEGDIGDLEHKMDQGEKSVHGFASKAGAAASRGSEIITGAMHSIGTAVVDMGLKFARAAFDYGNKAADLASDINESVSKINTLFGKSGSEVDRWANTTAKSLGISRAAALDAAGNYGNLFRAMNVGQKASADLSQRMVKLAADFASFNNTSPEQAMDAIRSGLVGESEPLRQYGVMISEVAIKNQALKMGLISSTKEALEPQTKALATIELMYKQSAAAQNDFSKTASGAANQQRILSAELEDGQAKLGKYLLPLKAFTIKALVAGVEEATPVLEKFGQTIADVFNPANLKAAGNTFQELWSDVQKYTKPAVDFVVREWGIVSSWFKENLPEIKRTVQTVVTFINEWWAKHGTQVKAVVIPAWNILKTAIETTLKAILTAVSFAMHVINGEWDKAGLDLKKLAVNYATGFQSIATNAQKLLLGGLKLVASSLADLNKRFWTAAWGLGQAIWQGMVNGVKSGVSYVREAAIELALSIPKNVSDILDIHSPSRVMHKKGQDTAEGFASGIDAGTIAAARAGQRLATAAADAAGGGKGKKGKAGKGKSGGFYQAGKDAALDFALGLIEGGSVVNAAWDDFLSKARDAKQTTGDLLKDSRRNVLIAKYGDNSAPVLFNDNPIAGRDNAIRTAAQLSADQRTIAHYEALKAAGELRPPAANLSATNTAVADAAAALLDQARRHLTAGIEPLAHPDLMAPRPRLGPKQLSTGTLNTIDRFGGFARDAFSDLLSGDGDSIMRRVSSRFSGFLKDSLSDALQRGVVSGLKSLAQKQFADLGKGLEGSFKGALAGVQASVYQMLSQAYSLLAIMGGMGRKKQRGGIFGAILGGVAAIATGGAALPFITAGSAIGSFLADPDLSGLIGVGTSLAGAGAFGSGAKISGLGPGGIPLASAGNKSRAAAINFNGPVTVNNGAGLRDIVRGVETGLRTQT